MVESGRGTEIEGEIEEGIKGRQRGGREREREGARDERERELKGRGIDMETR